MLDLSKLTDQEAIVLEQAMELLATETAPSSDCVAVASSERLLTQLTQENRKRYERANQPSRQHTLIVEVPPEITDEQLREYGGVIYAELAFGAHTDGTPRETVGVDVIEHHFERMIEELGREE